MMLGDEGEHAALALDGQTVRVRDDFDRVDGPPGEAIDGVEDLERPHQIELVDGRHHDDDDAAAGGGAAHALTMRPRLRLAQTERAKWRIPTDLCRNAPCRPPYPAQHESPLAWRRWRRAHRWRRASRASRRSNRRANGTRPGRTHRGPASPRRRHRRFRSR